MTNSKNLPEEYSNEEDQMKTLMIKNPMLIKCKHLNKGN